MAVKILAADDSSTMRKVLQMTFAGEAVEIETVDGGEAAVERALQSSPDLVIADVSMEMDGYEVARALKSRPSTQGVAVIVLASQHNPFDAEKGRAAGVDDHILKPFDSQALIEKARDVLSRPRARAAGAAVEASPPPPDARSGLPIPRPAAPPAGGAATAEPTPRVGPPATAQPAGRSTVAFGAVPPPKPARPVLELAEDDLAHPTARPTTPAPTATLLATTPAAAATGEDSPMAARLVELGLTAEQVEGVLALSREVIERVVWEVVPDLAEVIIREEIRRLTAE